MRAKILIFYIIFFGFINSVNSQVYSNFKFKEINTRHFNILYYDLNKETIFKYKFQAERWRNRINEILKHELMSKNPIIFYNNHPDFLQNQVANVSVGTGGVTEGGRNRVLLPFNEINHQTDHVLGHELVHAFQYDIVRKNDSTSFNGLFKLPLWLIEGMAEYISLGENNILTSMWLRDAVLNQDIPTIDNLSNSQKYFPYRYGHAFWAFIVNGWGEDMVRTLFLSSVKYGFENACLIELGVNTISLTKMWHTSLRSLYSEYIKTKQNYFSYGQLVYKVDEKTLFKKNYFGPSLSPNGKEMAIFTNKDLFSIDLFIADAYNGKLKKSLTNEITSIHYDAMNFIENTGTWSPDGKYFAYSAVVNGDSRLIITKRKGFLNTNKEFHFKEIPSIIHLSWSPDGKKIALVGLVDGESDIYIFDVKTESIVKLTNDQYSDVHLSWNNKSTEILFSSDRGKDSDLSIRKFDELEIYKIDINTKEIKYIPLFKNGNHICPFYGKDDKTIYFVANPDGINNIYEYNLDSNKIFKRTDVATGVSGITDYSSALTVSLDTKDLLFTVFEKGSENLYRINNDSISKNNFIIPKEIDLNFPQKYSKISPDINLNFEKKLESNLIKYKNFVSDSFYFFSKYKPTLSLTGLSSGVIGVGVTSGYGNALYGGISGVFQDLLNHHNLYTSISLNGDIKDGSIAVGYLNQKHRINFGGYFQHYSIPSAYYSINTNDSVIINNSYVYTQSQSNIVRRILKQDVAATFVYPLNNKTRLQLQTGANIYSFFETVNKLHYKNGIGVKNEFSEQTYRDPLVIGFQDVSLIVYNAYFGVTSPIKGTYFIFSNLLNYGNLNYYGVNIDFRKYFYVYPVTFAFRLNHIGRYFGDANSNLLLNNFNLGRIGLETPVRGYTTFSNYGKNATDNFKYKRLFGSKIVGFKAEIRYPIVGIKELGSLFKSKFFFLEVAPFFDAGFTFDENLDEVELSFDINNQKRIIISSVGVTSRLNLLGVIVLEFFYAWMFQHPEETGAFGFNIIPGW